MKIHADDVLVTGTHKVGKRPSIPTSEVENARRWIDIACQPRKAKRVPKTLFTRHTIPVRYLRWYNSRRIHSSKVTSARASPRCPGVGLWGDISLEGRFWTDCRLLFYPIRSISGFPSLGRSLSDC